MIHIAEKSKVSHFLVFYLIHSFQFGVGVLGFQRFISKRSENDAWIAVIVSGVCTHLIVWMIYKILKDSNGNIATIHQDLFGKKIGNVLNFLFYLYFVIWAINALMVYVELVEVWMFPTVNRWVFSFCFLALVYYIVASGFRVVTGMAFFGIVLTSYIFLLFLYPLQFSKIEHLFPMFSHSLTDILLSAKEMSLTITGVEILLVLYPFVKKQEQSKKWAHLAVAYSTMIYTFIMLISIVFFSKGQLEKNIWATLTMWKIVELPFLERFEYIGIANWNLIILPNVCIAVWCASRILKDSFKYKQKYMLIIALCITYIGVNLLRTRVEIEFYKSFVSDLSFYVVYCYIPVLFLIAMMIHKIKERKT